jgi:hypothetical protein
MLWNADERAINRRVWKIGKLAMCSGSYCRQNQNRKAKSPYLPQSRGTSFA